MKFSFLGLFLIVLGGLYLCNNLGILDIDWGMIWERFWPIVLILVGIGMFFERKEKKEK